MGQKQSIAPALAHLARGIKTYSTTVFSKPAKGRKAANQNATKPLVRATPSRFPSSRFAEETKVPLPRARVSIIYPRGRGMVQQPEAAMIDHACLLHGQSPRHPYKPNMVIQLNTSGSMRVIITHHVGIRLRSWIARVCDRASSSSAELGFIFKWKTLKYFSCYTLPHSLLLVVASSSATFSSR